jgi:FlaA1/EpsC-like NDP-sugar epimerase
MPKLIAEKRTWLVVVIQLVIIVAAFFLAFLFRFDMRIPEKFQPLLPAILPVLIVIKLLFFWYMGLLRGWWRYVSMADLITILKANVLASLTFVAYAVIVYRLEKIPRSVLILDGIFCFLMMGGVRFVTRAFRENYLPMPRSSREVESRVLIVGAGDAGQAIAREIRQNPRLQFKAVGFVDDDAQKQGVAFQGVKVLGRQDDLARICHNKDIDEVIIAIPSATGPQVRGIVEKCQEAGVKFKTLPGVGDLIDGRVSVQSIRDVALEDLLGREPIVLEVDRIRAYLKGKRVLVSGAGGSIGSEICRQIARFQPGKLILFDNAETPLFNIERELVEHFPEIPLSPVVGDIRYRARVEAVFDQYLPEVVFHAAAYKHVPMMEHNPAEAVNNNVRGSQVLADAAHEHVVETFVMISTDKAVNPTNVMGASKRAAELYVQGLARESRTRFVTVRFGNVLGSNGSVVPIFREQIAKGGPVTVTHPEVTRFFMTIPEATQLVLQAGSMGKGGEILLLDMGQPVRILHLAEELIRLSGLRPHEDIEIVFTGLRPGEKLYEELLLTGEGIVPTTHASIMIARAAECDRAALQASLEQLYTAARNMDHAAVVAILKETVPEFRPEDAGAEMAPQHE